MVRIIIETDDQGNILRTMTEDGAMVADDGAGFEDAGGPPADLLAELGEDVDDSMQFAAQSVEDDTNAEDAGGPPPELGGSDPAFDAQMNADAEDAGGPAEWLVAAVEGNEDASSDDTDDDTDSAPETDVDGASDGGSAE